MNRKRVTQKARYKQSFEPPLFIFPAKKKKGRGTQGANNSMVSLP
ncbi:hypothetical protein [Heyndrickxia acidicola]|uniref:Ribosomal protein L32 n=1 Tax=Heyndrickxia acidicola TaxID=209389 RepID=A0ABU6MF93_9BACI|nr:hypothetical protein [Heyndrickxia acidicola]